MAPSYLSWRDMSREDSCSCSSHRFNRRRLVFWSPCCRARWAISVLLKHLWSTYVAGSERYELHLCEDCVKCCAETWRWAVWSLVPGSDSAQISFDDKYCQLWVDFWCSLHSLFLVITLSPELLFIAIQEAFQIGIYWAHTNTVHKSTALKLVHDLTSPRWKEGSSSEVVTLDEEGYVEADITLGAFPGKQKVRETP